MTRTLWRVGTLLLSVVISVLMALAVARLRAFAIADVSGAIYLCFWTPIVAALFAAVLLALLPASLGGPRRSALAVVVVAGASLVVHSLALSARAIGGSYELPVGFDAGAKSEKELETIVWDRNYAVAGAALLELGRRGDVGADALVRILGEAQRRFGPPFVDATLTMDAVEILAERRDRRVVPVLEAMLRSSWSIMETVFDAQRHPHRTMVFTTRSFAARMLSNAFGVEARVETRKPID